MRPIRLRLQAAGLGHLDPLKLGIAWIVGLALLVFVLVKATGLVALGIAAIFLSGAFSYEFLILQARARQSTLLAVLPQICESLSSAVSTGLDLQRAFEDLAIAGPKATRGSFSLFTQMLQTGTRLEDGLDWLKIELAHADADQLVEFLRLSRTSGGSGLAANLNRLAEQLRKQAALAGEISAKQGWVTGTAKLALATPWLIVLLLGSRPENALAYNSTSGLLVLSLGLLVCLIAYAVINAVSALPQQKRVFAK